MTFVFTAACSNEPEVDGLQLLEEYLGVSFTVNPVEITWINHSWQFLELHDELNLDNFPGVFDGSLLSLFVSITEKGDVLIVTCPEGNQYLHINQGGRAFYVSELDVMVELESTETLTWTELVRQESEAAERERFEKHIELLAEFDMHVQFETEHFIFISTDQHIRHLEAMMEAFDEYIDFLLLALDAEMPTIRTVIELHTTFDTFRDSLRMISGSFITDKMIDGIAVGAYQSTSGLNHILGSFHMNPTASPSIAGSLFIHEYVHIIDIYNYGWRCMVSAETVATFLQTSNYERWIDGLQSNLRDGMRPTLQELNNLPAGTLHEFAYGYAEFILINFGHNTLLELLRGNRLPDITGYTMGELNEMWLDFLNNYSPRNRDIAMGVLMESIEYRRAA